MDNEKRNKIRDVINLRDKLKIVIEKKKFMIAQKKKKKEVDLRKWLMLDRLYKTYRPKLDQLVAELGLDQKTKAKKTENKD